MNEQSSREEPRLAVITVTFDCVETVGPTLDSVVGLRDSGLELIVVDGQSRDGTRELLEARADEIDRLLIEPDDGIYDAMNKACGLLTAPYHLFLNAGDRFVEPPDPRSIEGPCVLDVYTHDYFGRHRRIRRKHPWFGMPYCHQGIVFESRGLRFDTTLTIAADYQYFLDHGYLELPPAPGSVYFDGAGTSQVRHEERDRQIQDIVTRRFGQVAGATFRANVTTKKIARRLLGPRRSAADD